MSGPDWIVLIVTLGLTLFGGFRRDREKSLKSYLRGSSSIRRFTIAMSVMATQASAITFISAPGQAYTYGMSYIQLYFGLPLAMVIVALVFVPRYVQTGIFTAYQFLELRFNREVRFLAAGLFLVQRGLAAGFAFFIPAFVLSIIAGFPLGATVLILGMLVITYTVFGGADAIARTQLLQMAVKIFGLIVVGAAAWFSLPQDLTIRGALKTAQLYDRLNLVSFSKDLKERYTIWAGLTGGLFLALSYFATDQSQVQRYLSGGSMKESQLGLIFNGIFKIPFQLMVLLSGVLVFLFYRFHSEPITFHPLARGYLSSSEFQELNERYITLQSAELSALNAYLKGHASADDVLKLHQQREKLRIEGQKKVSDHFGAEANEADYIFLSFILEHLPKGFAGLFIAAILCAALSTAASEMSALGTTTVIDFLKELRSIPTSDHEVLRLTKVATALWGALAICAAFLFSRAENLIQGINILGSLFYGVLLSIFFMANLSVRPHPRSVILAAVIGEVIVVGLHLYGELGFLWYNAVGFIAVLVTSYALNGIIARKV